MADRECTYCGDVVKARNGKHARCPVCNRACHARCLKAHMEHWSDAPKTHDVEEYGGFMLPAQEIEQ